jgi:hypothetical protein
MGKMRVPVLASLALLAVQLGCGGAAVFVCAESGECGGAGVCEPSGYCSFPDAACGSMQRYGAHAPESLAGECVDPLPGTSSGAVADGGSSSGTLDPGSTGVVGSMGSEEDDGDASSSGPPPGTTGPLVGTSSSESSGGGGVPVVLGPMTITDDVDDGAMWPGNKSDMGAWLPSGETPGFGFCGEVSPGYAYFAYLRFELPAAIPADAVIDSAVLEMFGHATYLWDDTHALRVWAEQSDDAAVVDSLLDYPAGGEGVALTMSSVRWADDDTGLTWQVPGPNPSSDLAPLLQELVDGHDGLDEGAHVQLWVAEDVIDGKGEEVGWLDSSAGGETAPRLTVTLVATD